MASKAKQSVLRLCSVLPHAKKQIFKVKKSSNWSVAGPSVTPFWSEASLSWRQGHEHTDTDVSDDTTRGTYATFFRSWNARPARPDGPDGHRDDFDAFDVRRSGEPESSESERKFQLKSFIENAHSFRFIQLEFQLPVMARKQTCHNVASWSSWSYHLLSHLSMR